MRNLRVLFLRLIVNAIMMLAGYGIACGACNMFFGTSVGFKFWFTLIFAGWFVSIAIEDIQAFINAQNSRHR